MSITIPQTVLIRTAARLAGNVASRVSQAVGFDEVLSGPEARGPESPPGGLPDVATLQANLRQAVHKRLSSAGITMNQPLNLRVSSGGRLHVDSEHPRAAEIESLLGSDPKLRELAVQLKQASDESEFSIDLTIRSERANMVGPGGYPNW